MSLRLDTKIVEALPSEVARLFTEALGSSVKDEAVFLRSVEVRGRFHGFDFALRFTDPDCILVSVGYLPKKRMGER